LQDEDQQTECKLCPSDTSTKGEGAADIKLCTNRCKVIIAFETWNILSMTSSLNIHRYVSYIGSKSAADLVFFDWESDSDPSSNFDADRPFFSLTFLQLNFSIYIIKYGK
jgi:hypothetical protein